MELVEPVHLAEIACPHCGHRWRPRVETPFKCTRCGKQIPYKKEQEKPEGATLAGETPKALGNPTTQEGKPIE